MYKDKAKQRAATRKAVQKHRVLHQGITRDNLNGEGITSTQGITPLRSQIEASSYPDIIDKLTDPFWRGRLEKICSAFKNSHHPSYINDVWMGDFNLSQVCELLDCTS